MGFWSGKKVFLTGHTGFKGSWLSIWLNKMGAEVFGYSLDAPTKPSLYNVANVNNCLHSTINDIRNLESVKIALKESKADVVFHMAAQPLVRLSYDFPVETYETNIMGTVNLLEAVRYVGSVKAVVIITTDKCYENKEWEWGYREYEPMGGFDPYSSSKGAAELVVSAYKNSFFNINDYNKKHKVLVASVRAGNVIGGGDWAKDRLIPDCMMALTNGNKIEIRNPNSIRPWEHVLEPLSGYLMVAEKLYSGNVNFAEAWNFGSDDSDAKPVGYIVDKICKLWGENSSYIINEDPNAPHEATYLKLDCSKAKNKLGWCPTWNLDIALEKIVEWYKSYENNYDMKNICIKQIDEFEQERVNK